MEGYFENVKRALSDHYELIREIGSGARAVVFLARDLKHGRPVAVKVLRPEFGSSVGGERFLREIGIAARLTHPNILPLHDSGESSGVLWYVMPYVEGETLRNRINSTGPLPIAEAV